MNIEWITDREPTEEDCPFLTTEKAGHFCALSSPAYFDERSLAWIPFSAIGIAPYEKPEEPQDCPFCGGAPIIDCMFRGSWVSCGDELCVFEGPYCENEREAIAAWNRIKVEKG